MNTYTRDIPGYEGRYQVSSLGNIYSYLQGSRKKRKINIRQDGYKGVVLVKDGRQERLLVHRLVLLAFVGPCPKGMEARHFPDATKTNCHLDNLCWGTKKQNQGDRVFHGTDNSGERSGNAKLTWKIIRKIRKLYANGSYTQSEVSRIFRIPRPTIHEILINKSWKEKYIETK